MYTEFRAGDTRGPVKHARVTRARHSKHAAPLSLGEFPLLHGLPENVLRAIADKTVEKGFPKNALIVSEGEFAASLYLVLAGAVKVFLAEESGKEIVLDVKGAGGYFGEMTLDDQPRSASIATVEPSRFAIISKADFRQILLDYPAVSLRVITDLIRIIRGLNKNVRGLTMLNVYGRVSRLLLDLAVDQEGKLVIAGKLTQQEIANRVGSSREMVSRIFRGLAARGYIRVEGRRLTIEKALPPRL